eukprot:TRINITY_DN14404_c0_g1_i2.p1 TRINITY_DN14404_c0_g1~~TRINITY_DN14404_c0_g1_i2.p1  ORF type:complete len:133 (+),score=5.26 TRINITY_DN14404_c0_g1_i2:2-400(+)
MTLAIPLPTRNSCCNGKIGGKTASDAIEARTQAIAWASANGASRPRATAPRHHFEVVTRIPRKVGGGFDVVEGRRVVIDVAAAEQAALLAASGAEHDGYRISVAQPIHADGDLAEVVWLKGYPLEEKQCILP